MIRFRNSILENYSIDPETAIITNSKGEIQETHILNGRPCFKGHGVHQFQMHTHLGYKKGFDIHHIDKNKLNNSLSNLVYLPKSEHSKLHNKGENHPMYGKTGKKHPMYGKHHSLESIRKIREANKGRTFSEDHKRKLSEANKGRNKDRIWINNGIENRYIPLDSEIPEGFIKGRTFSEETKQKMSKSHKGKTSSNKGKRYKWINNSVEEKQIPLDEYIPEGFIRGRLKRKIS